MTHYVIQACPREGDDCEIYRCVDHGPRGGINAIYWCGDITHAQQIAEIAEALTIAEEAADDLLDHEIWIIDHNRRAVQSVQPSNAASP